MTKSIHAGLFGSKRLTGCALAVALLFAGMSALAANPVAKIGDTESNRLGETFFEKNDDGSFKVEGGKPYYFSEEHAWNAKNNMPDGTSEEVWMEANSEDRRGYVAVGQDIELDENGDVIGGEFTYIVPEIVNESLMPEAGSGIDEKTGTPD